MLMDLFPVEELKALAIISTFATVQSSTWQSTLLVLIECASCQYCTPQIAIYIAIFTLEKLGKISTF